MCMSVAGRNTAAEVVAMACNAADAGQQWDYDGFNDTNLLNRATLTCLTFNRNAPPSTAGHSGGGSGTVTVEPCDQGGEDADQQWALAAGVQPQPLSLVSSNSPLGPSGQLHGTGCAYNATFPAMQQGVGVLGQLPASVGGKQGLTISALVKNSGSNLNAAWSRVVDLGNGQSDNSATHTLPSEPPRCARVLPSVSADVRALLTTASHSKGNAMTTSCLRIRGRPAT